MICKFCPEVPEMYCGTKSKKWKLSLYVSLDKIIAKWINIYIPNMLQLFTHVNQLILYLCKYLLDSSTSVLEFFVSCFSTTLFSSFSLSVNYFILLGTRPCLLLYFSVKRVVSHLHTCLTIDCRTNPTGLAGGNSHGNLARCPLWHTVDLHYNGI